MANVKGQDIETQRLTMATPLRSRDGTLTYDGHITNGYVEKQTESDMIRVYKRAGMTKLYSLGVDTGKGITSYIDANGNQQLLFAQGQTIGLPTPNTLSASQTWTSKNGPVLAIGRAPVYFVKDDILYALQANSAGTQVDCYSKTDITASSWTTVKTNVISTPHVPTYGGGLVLQFQGLWFYVPSNQSTIYTTIDPTSTWTWRTDTPGWNATGSSTPLLEYNGYLWHFDQDVSHGNEIWRSVDGITWTMVAQTPAYDPDGVGGNYRRNATFFGAKGKLWIVGGVDSGTTLQPSVWNSSDGITWTQVTADWGLTNDRENPLAYAVNDRVLYVQGGLKASTGTYYDDLWTSTDGVTWTQLQATTTGLSFFTNTGYNANNVMTLSNGTLIISAQANQGGPPNQVYPYAYTTPTTLNITSVGTVTIADDDFVDFATDYLQTQIMVRSRSKSWKFDPNLLTFTAISDVDFPSTTVRGCVYLDGTFYVMNNKGTIYGSDLDNCTSWNATNFIAAEFDPDGGVFLGKKDAYVVAFGTQTTQFFYDAGNDVGSPLSPVLNGTFNVGCAHGNSAQQLESTIIWLAQAKAFGVSHQQGRFVAILDGQQSYKKISTPDIDRILNQDDLANIYSFTMSEKGHIFYGLSLVTSGITLIYDLTNDFWTVWTLSTAGTAKSVSALTQSNGVATATCTGHGFADGDEITIAGASPSGYNLTVNITYVNANSFTYPVSSSLTSPATGTITATGQTESYFDMVASCSFGDHTVFQDATGGVIWQMDETNVQDNLVSINFKCRTPNYTFGNNKNKYLSQVNFIGNMTSTADVGMLRTTIDDFQTYGTYRQISLNTDYPSMNAWGKSRRVAFEWRHTSANKHYIDALEVDFKQGIH